MSNYDELDKALVGLSNAAAGVREKLMHLPPQSNSDTGCQIRESMGVVHYVTTGEYLDFGQGGQELIEVERLLRIIANASEAAGRLGVYIKGSKSSDPTNPHKVSKPAAMSYAVKLRDSLGSLANLLGAESTSDRFLEERSSVFTKEKTVDDVLEDAEKLTLAFVYQRLKTLRNNLNSYLDSHEFQDIINEISDLMDEIQKGKPNGQ